MKKGGSKKWKNKQRKLEILAPKGPDESELIGKIDVGNKDVQVYLVKMPEYLAEQFEDPTNGVVGRMRISENMPRNGQSQSESARIFLDKPRPSKKLNIHNKKEMVTEYNLAFIPGMHETMVFSSNAKGEDENVQIEGRVLHTCHAKPKLDSSYARLTNIRSKMSKMRPRELMELDQKERKAAERASFRPDDMTPSAKEREEKKRQRERAKSHLDIPTEKWTAITTEAMFKAFGEHPFYTAENLARDLGETVHRLRPLLQKYCQYKKSGPFSGHYELKNHLQTDDLLKSRRELEEKHREHQLERARQRKAEREGEDDAPPSKKVKRS